MRLRKPHRRDGNGSTNTNIQYVQRRGTGSWRNTRCGTIALGTIALLDTRQNDQTTGEANADALALQVGNTSEIVPLLSYSLDETGCCCCLPAAAASPAASAPPAAPSTSTLPMALRWRRVPNACWRGGVVQEEVEAGLGMGGGAPSVLLALHASKAA